MATMTSASDEKWRPVNCFSVQGPGGSLMGPDPENRMRDQDTGNPGSSFFLDCKCQVKWRIVVKEQEHLGDLPTAIFLQMSFICISRDE